MHVREAEVAAGVTECELLVIEAEQVHVHDFNATILMGRKY